MKPIPALAAAVLLSAVLTACGGKDKPAAHATPPASLEVSQATGPSSPSSSPHRVPHASLSAVGAANTIDPCKLVIQDEASTMTHARFGPGQEQGNKIRRECVYGGQTTNVLTVFVIQAASTGDAQAGWDQLLAQAKQGAGQAAHLVHLSPGTGIGDRSEWLELDLPQIDVAGRGLAFLKGDVGVYLIDEVRGGSAPTQDAMTAEAQTVLDRLP
jgi:hypothetical protein